MLTPYRPQFIEKILTDSFGRQYHVLFAVSFVDGEIRGQVISATPIQIIARLNGGAVSNNRFCLPCAQSFNLSIFNLSIPAPIASPYIELYFFNSQPTRAPSR